MLPGSFVAAVGFRDRVVTRPLPFELASLRVTMLWHMRSDQAASHACLRSQLEKAASAELGWCGPRIVVREALPTDPRGLARHLTDGV